LGWKSICDAKFRINRNRKNRSRRMADYEVGNSNGRSRWPIVVVVFVIGCVGGVYALREYKLGKTFDSVRATVVEYFAKPAAPAAPIAGAPSVDPALAVITPNQPAAPAPATTPTQAPAPVPAQTNDNVQRELQALRAEVNRLKNTQNNTAAAPNQFGTPAPVTPQQTNQTTNSTGTPTLAYWNNLNLIFARESAMRSAPPQIDAMNAGSFVSGRTTAFQYAGDAIRRLDTRGVDPTLTSFAQEIARWYDQGIANSRLAESLLGSSDVASRQGAPGQSWQAAEKSHREQNLAINRRGEQLQQEFSHKFGLDFPPMQ
jgi:hypothetical protein